jgi:hypothetical protein
MWRLQCAQGTQVLPVALADFLLDAIAALQRWVLPLISVIRMRKG